MIVWGPQQYAPIHDHPSGGCMVKVARGPGIKETIYRKLPRVKDLPKQYFCCQQRNIVAPNNETHIALLEKQNSYGCDINNFSTDVLQEVETFTAAIGNDNEVRTLIGHDSMHTVWNPFNESSYALSHYLGDFTRIASWFPDDYEHSTKCLSRGDDTRRNKTTNFRSASTSIGEGCDACST